MNYQLTERDLRIQQLRLIVFIMLIIFACILSYTIYWIVDYNKHYGFFERSEAKVIEHSEIEGMVHDVLYYQIDGNEYKLTIETESKYDVGEIITIYYDENNPLGIIYSLDNRRILLPVLTIFFGVACIGLLITYILINNSNKKQKGKLNIIKNKPSDI